MNLPSKIAGTLALPLALAIASTSHAAVTVFENDNHRINFGGYVSAISSWAEPQDGADLRHNMNLGNSRFGVGYTNKELGASFYYEQLIGAPHGNDISLRHAYLSTTSGWVAGWTWSFGSNLTSLAETIDVGGPERAAFGYNGGVAARNAVLGKNFKLADNMSVGVAIEDKLTNDEPGVNDQRDAVETAVPDIAVNFKGNFNGTQVFAAVTHYNMNVGTPADPDDDSFVRATAGLSLPLGDALNLKVGATLDDKDLYASAGLGIKINDQVRSNLVFEHNDYDDSGDTMTSVWLNLFYKANNGVEWGAEVQSVSADDDQRAGHPRSGDTLGDKGYALRLQAKYAF